VIYPQRLTRRPGLSRLFGDGLGLGFARGGFTPAGLSGCVLGHLYDSTASMFTTDVGAVVANNTDPVGRVVALAGPNGLQSSSGLRPTRQSNGLQLDTTDDRLDWTEVQLTGDFTIYAAGTVGASAIWAPLGEAGTNVFSCVSMYDPASSAGQKSQINIGRFGLGTLVAYKFQEPAVSAVLVRFRRVGTTMYHAATGVSEASTTCTTVPFYTSALGMIGNYGRSNSTLHRYYANFLYSRDLTAGERAQVESWYSARGYAL
jgi:hypothetical protein